VKVSIQNKIQPRVSQRQAEIEEPARYGHEPGLETNHEAEGKQALKMQQTLLKAQISRETMDANKFVHVVDFWHENLERESPFVSIKGVKEAKPEQQFGQQQSAHYDSVQRQSLWGAPEGGFQAAECLHRSTRYLQFLQWSSRIARVPNVML
jgi:hypothetical protein